MVERIILKKVKNSEELVLDMVSTPEYVLKSVDWGTIKSTHQSYKYVNQVGVTISNTSLESRSITIEGWIVAANSIHMDNLKKKLNSFVNKKPKQKRVKIPKVKQYSFYYLSVLQTNFFYF